jgi:tyrosyl-tRNA synthetase
MDTTIATRNAAELARQQGVNPLDYLRARGYVQDVTDPNGLAEAFAAGPVTVYVGYDPTAASLHIGNLVSIMMLASLQRMGHRPIALGGGGTVMIGDPSGKTSERQLLTIEKIEENLSAILPQFARYLDFEGGRFGGNQPALLINNADWLLALELIPFLRDVGRHFSVNEMLAAETYRARLESGLGLSFLEFNYRVLQAYDFLHLFRTRDCVLQMGGSDQWGNITAGVDLIRRAEGGKAFGLVCPLVTTSDGRKMGKSESGAIWLDRERTSPFEFYQWWLNTTDEDIARFLRLYTFLPDEQIQELTSVEGAALREAKEVLAVEATAMTHGEATADEVRAASRALFARDRAPAPVGEVPEGAVVEEVTATPDMTIAELFMAAGLVASRNEARRLAAQGGLALNEQRVTNADAPFEPTGDVVLLRVGKKRYRYARLT